MFCEHDGRNTVFLMKEKFVYSGLFTSSVRSLRQKKLKPKLPTNTLRKERRKKGSFKLLVVKTVVAVFYIIHSFSLSTNRFIITHHASRITHHRYHPSQPKAVNRR